MAMDLGSLGSLSNVGVRAQREQNPRPEGTEVSEPEGDPLERLDCVVATLGKPIGQAKIESVEYVGLPAVSYTHLEPERSGATGSEAACESCAVLKVREKRRRGER